MKKLTLIFIVISSLLFGCTKKTETTTPNDTSVIASDSSKLDSVVKVIDSTVKDSFKGK